MKHGLFQNIGLRIWPLGPQWHLFHPLVVDHVPYVWRAPLDAIGEGAHCPLVEPSLVAPAS